MMPGEKKNQEVNADKPFVDFLVSKYYTTLQVVVRIQRKIWGYV
jgi:hypothetical protein